MSSYVIVIFFLFAIHREIKMVDLNLNVLLLKVFLSLFISSFAVYFEEPSYLFTSDSISIYAMVWLLIIISYVLHWMYRKKQSNVSN